MGNVLYYQLNIDYIIETYCVNKEQPELQCNGKCHLAKQLQISDESNSNEQPAYNLLHEAFYPVFYQNQNKVHEKLLYSLVRYNNWTYSTNLKNTFVNNCFRPPRRMFV